MRHGGPFRLLPGQPTDDSQMAITLLRALVRHGGVFDVDTVREGYKRWLASEPFDVGITVSQALKFAPAKESRSNGALMRGSPIAVAYANDPAAARRAAEADARITHLHPVVIDANATFMTGLVAGLQGADAAGALQAMREVARTEEVIAALAGHYHHYEEHMGWVLLSLSIASWAVGRAADVGCEQALIDVVGIGDDTDTHAAIAGALLGATHGVSAWPARWIAPVLTCTPDDELLEPDKRLGRQYWAVDVLVLVDCLLP